jgi:sulfhydrogenase subunit beta (sulfur reductase)
MRTSVITKDNLYKFLDNILRNTPVMAPAQRKDQPGFTQFRYLEGAHEFVTDYVTTTLPPKKAFFQPSEVLFTFEAGDPPKLELVSDTTPFVLAGVHPCDLAGLRLLDKAYAHPPSEDRWGADRKLATVIGVDCIPDDYCFCHSMNNMEFREGADLFLTPIERGFLVEIISKAGEELLELAELSETLEKDLSDAKSFRDGKLEAMKAGLDEGVDRLADVLESVELAPIWEEVAHRCYSCGSCNTTCPTCFCFEMHDEFNLDLKSGLRRRTWDSCQLLEFSLVAGRHIFRDKRSARVKHRWKRKFLYLYKRLGSPYCVGCGRCSRACVADINIVDVTNSIFKAASGPPGDKEL